MTSLPLALGVALLGGLGAVGRYLIHAAIVRGAFTTFSTWMWETERMVADGQRRGAAAGVAVSLLAGLGAVALGVYCGDLI